MTTKSKIKKYQRLTDIEAMEVSMVDKGANKKKFVMVKRDSAEAAHLETLAKAQEGDQDAIKEILKSLFDKVSEDTLKELGLQKLDVAKEEGTPEDGTPEEGAAGEGDEGNQEPEEAKKAEGDEGTPDDATTAAAKMVAEAVKEAVEPFTKKVEASLATMEKKVNTVSESVASSQVRADAPPAEAKTFTTNLGGKSLRE